jgi:hypothetical protein
LNGQALYRLGGVIFPRTAVPREKKRACPKRAQERDGLKSDHHRALDLLPDHDGFESRHPPRITSGAGFVRIML